jgi:hypothetical protein
LVDYCVFILIDIKWIILFLRAQKCFHKMAVKVCRLKWELDVQNRQHGLTVKIQEPKIPVFVYKSATVTVIQNKLQKMSTDYRSGSGKILVFWL